MYLHYSNNEGLNMGVCKICGKRITIFSEILLCTVCHDEVHIKCALYDPKIFNENQIPEWIRNKCRKIFFSLKEQKGGWILEGKICYYCHSETRRKILAFIKEQKIWIIEEQRIKEDKKRKMEAKKRRDLKITAKQYENTSRYDDAIKIYDKYKMKKDVMRCQRLVKQNIREREEEKKRQELEIAKNYMIALRYDEAIRIFEKYEMRKDVMRCQRLARQKTIERKKEKKRQELKKANNYELALRFGDAIEIYEKYEMWEEAGRCRRLQRKEKTPQTKVEIGKIDQSTRVSDSVIQRSSIGGNTQKKIQICPYCGEELNFPETPRYCPYCRKQILS